MDDREVARLVNRVLAGERESFHPIVREFTPVLYNLARKMGASADDAMEIVQETFLRAFRDLGRYDSTSRFFCWIYGIGVNVCYDAGKRRKRGAERESPLDANSELVPAEGPDAQAIYEARQRQVRLRECLGRLPESQRSALLLRYQADLTLEEVSAVLHVKLSAAKMRIQRGLDALRDQCHGLDPGGWS